MATVILIVAAITLVSTWIIGFYLDHLSGEVKDIKETLTTLLSGPPKGGGSHERAE
jgi:hypothetical protein